MKKKIICFILLMTIFLGVFTGCTIDTGPKIDPTKTQLKISFTKAGFGSEMYERLAEGFMAEHPDVQVILEGNYSMNDLIGTRLETNTQVSDIFEVSYMAQWEKWSIEGYLEDLTDLYSEEIESGQTLKDKLQPDMKEYGLLNDKYWAVPYIDGVTGIIYNVKMFEEHGWEVPKTTYDLLNLCEDMLDEGITPFVYPGKVAGGYMDFIVQGWWFQYEGEEKIKEFFEFGSPEVFKQEGRLKALEMYERLFITNSKYSMPGCMGKTHIDAQTDFIQGKAAMITGASYFETEMKTTLAKYPDFEMAMMPLPFISDDQGNILAQKDENGNPIRINNTMAESGYIIPKNAKQKELAKEFLLYIARETSLQTFTQYTNTPRPYNYDISTIAKDLSPFAQSCLEIWQNSTNIHGISHHPMFIAGKVGVWPQAGFHYNRMYNGSATARDCYQSDYNWVKENWERFKEEVGMS